MSAPADAHERRVRVSSEAFLDARHAVPLGAKFRVGYVGVRFGTMVILYHQTNASMFVSY